MSLADELRQLLKLPQQLGSFPGLLTGITSRLDAIERQLQSVSEDAGKHSQVISDFIASNNKESDQPAFPITPNNPFLGSGIDQVNYLHTALLGYPLDAHSDAHHLLHSMTVHEMALKILRSPRFQNEIRAKVPLWPTDKWVQTTLHDLKIWINLKDSFIAMSILQGHYEEELVALMIANAPERGTVVDVGANVGAYTLQAARAVGAEGKVYAFEPRPDTFGMLSESVAANGFSGRCILLNQGLSDKAGYASMQDVDVHNPGASFVKEESDTQSGQRLVKLTVLDEIDFGDRVDFFKIDVEGYESKVLRGGASFFRRYKPAATSEVFPNMLREAGGSSAEEYLDLWDSYGYEVRLFDYQGSQRVLRPSDLRNEAEFPGLFNIVCHSRARS